MHLLRLPHSRVLLSVLLPLSIRPMIQTPPPPVSNDPFAPNTVPRLISVRICKQIRLLVELPFTNDEDTTFAMNEDTTFTNDEDLD